MKVLVETRPDHEVSLNPEASVVLGDTGHMDDVFVADEAVHRILDGRESRTSVFKHEDIVALRGIEKALESGAYDTSGTGIQVIPKEVSRPLLTAMELYYTIPEEEKAHLTDTEKHKWSIAVEALRGVLEGEDIVKLEPGVSPQDKLEEIIPDFAKPAKATGADDSYDYDWLYTPSDMKLNSMIPKPSVFANTTRDEDAETGVRLFKEKSPDEVAIGVGVAELLQPDVPILAKDTHDVAEKSTAPQLSPEQRALSLEITQDGMPAVVDGKTLAKR